MQSTGITVSPQNTFHYVKKDLKPNGVLLHKIVDTSFLYIFSIKGTLQINSEVNHFLIMENEYSLFYFNADQAISISSDDSAVVLVVQFHPKEILSRYRFTCCSIERLEDAIELEQTGSLFEKSVRHSNGMHLTLHEILSVLQKPTFQEYFLESLGYKLIGQYFEHQELLNVDCTHIKQFDLDKMHRVKNLIENNIQESLTISHLAKVVGTNEAYLKKQFKETFGSTIYGYTLQCKMEYSKNLLIESNFSISDIAYQVGYKHATHFTQAFKKYYGALPNSFRKIELS